MKEYLHGLDQRVSQGGRAGRGGVAGLKTLLTIAGLDPSCGAGATADLTVFAAHGFFGTCGVTALTVQSTLGVHGVHPVEARLLRETLELLCADLPPDGVKIGMLATGRNTVAVAEFLQDLRGRREGIPVVLDPVLRSTSGRDLLDAAGLEAMGEWLLPMVDWVTPNLQELCALVPEQDAGVDVEQAVAVLQRHYPGLGVVATAGDQGACDYVAEAKGASAWLAGEKLVSRATHGTGCAFSSALLCGLVQGLDGLEAARRAKAYVTEGIRQATPMGHGRGPMNLLWPLRTALEGRPADPGQGEPNQGG